MEVPRGLLEKLYVESLSEKANAKHHLQTFEQHIELVQILLVEEVDAITCKFLSRKKKEKRCDGLNHFKKV